MRSISLVDKLEVEFEGNVMQNAIRFGDVDNDNYNELIAGNVYGYLAIYKGQQPKPWRYACDLGLIACLMVGDIFNAGQNYLSVFSDDGRCYIFDISSVSSIDPIGRVTSNTDYWEDESKSAIEPVYTQCLPANIKDVLLSDVDGNGKLELVCCLTDRIVRTYKWQDVVASTTNSNVAGDDVSDSQQVISSGGYLMAVNKWELSHQIGNMSTNLDVCGASYLLISQPGGTYVSLQHSTNTETVRENMATDSDHNVLQNHTLGSSQARNTNISTEVVGGIECEARPAGCEDTARGLLALCTADGTISLVCGDHIMWSFQVDHQLFGITKLDVTRDGRDEVLVSSGCGATYIVDCSMNAVRFQFGDDIRTFCAGLFATGTEDGNQPAFAYVTYNSRIVIYYNISNVSMNIVGLQDTIDEYDAPEITRQMSQLQSDMSTTFTNPADIYRFCLYGLPHIKDREAKALAQHTLNHK